MRVVTSHRCQEAFASAQPVRNGHLRSPRSPSTGLLRMAPALTLSGYTGRALPFLCVGTGALGPPHLLGKPITCEQMLCFDTKGRADEEL